MRANVDGLSSRPPRCTVMSKSRAHVLARNTAKHGGRMDSHIGGVGTRKPQPSVPPAMLAAWHASIQRPSEQPWSGGHVLRLFPSASRTSRKSSEQPAPASGDPVSVTGAAASTVLVTSRLGPISRTAPASWRATHRRSTQISRPHWPSVMHSPATSSPQPDETRRARIKRRVGILHCHAASLKSSREDRHHNRRSQPIAAATNAWASS